MSARVIIAVWPFEGHVFPLLGVADALRDRGHAVAFLTGEQARGVIEAEGFPVFESSRVRPAWEAVHRLERRTSGRSTPVRAQQQALRNWLVETIPGQVGDLEDAVDRWDADVLLADFSIWGAPLVFAERSGIPVAVWCTLMGPQVPGPDAPAAWGLGLAPARGPGARAASWLIRRATDVLAGGLRRRLDEIRADHALPPLGRSINAAIGAAPLYLVGNVPEYDYGRGDLPSSVHYVGPCLWHPPASDETAAWLDAVPTARPWVHVTEGTSHHQEPFVLRAAAQGLAHDGVEAILTTGKQDRDPRQLGLDTPASNVHVTRWVGHDELLHRCAVVVTTGGAGTVIAALRAGVPLVVVPTGWDKPDNARRVTEAGVGVRLPARRCTPASLREAVHTVLGDRRYRANAAAAALRLGATPGPDRAAELLTSLVPERLAIR